MNVWIHVDQAAELDKATCEKATLLGSFESVECDPPTKQSDQAEEEVEEFKKPPLGRTNLKRGSQWFLWLNGAGFFRRMGQMGTGALGQSDRFPSDQRCFASDQRCFDVARQKMAAK